MINQGSNVDEGFVLAMAHKAANASVAKSSTAQAGQIPISDGNGGVTWGAATSGVVSAIDPDNNGQVTLQFIEGE